MSNTWLFDFSYFGLCATVMAEGGVKELLLDISDILRRKAELLESVDTGENTSGSKDSPTGIQCCLLR